MELFDPLSREMLTDPYPVYARLRDEDPIHWHEQLQAWVVSRHADCTQILQHHEVFRSDFRVIGEKTPNEFLSLQTLDLPDHGIVRKLILKSLRAIDQEDWMRETAQQATKLLASVDHTGFDFIKEFAEPLAAQSMCTLFGIPLLEDEVQFRSAQRDLVLSMDSGLDPSRRDAGMLARRHLSGLIEPWVEARPDSGLLSHIDFAAAGERLEFLVNSLRAIFVAGYSSTSSALGNALRVLTENGHLDCDSGVEIDDTAFNELVRFEGAVQAESRAVAEDAAIRGHTFHRGDVVVVLVGAANRDDIVFDNPDHLQLDRASGVHLGFGKGVHACVGTRLALMLGTGILTALSQRFTVRLIGAPEQRPTATLRGLDRLPVRLNERGQHQAQPADGISL